MPEPENNPMPMPAPETGSQKCPECGAEFDGDSVSRASEKLATLAEENAALKTELAAAQADASAAKDELAKAEKKTETPPVSDQPSAKKRRMLFGASKRAA